MGGGSEVDALRARAGAAVDKNVFFLPHQSLRAVKQAIRESHICLVSLAPCISRYAYPSKTMTYLGEGRPLLACIELDSDLAKLISDKQIGVAVPPCDPEALAAAISHLIDDPEKYEEILRHAAAIGPVLFGEQETLDKWSKLVLELACDEQ